jgi:hypothetical protein
MKNTVRVLVWPMAIFGSALLLWKGWEGMLFFLHSFAANTVDSPSEVPLALPGFLIATGSFILIAAVQVSSLWWASSEKRTFRLLRGALLLPAGIGLGKAAWDITLLFGDLTSTLTSGEDRSTFAWRFEEAAPFFHGGAICLAISTVFAALAMLRVTEPIARGLTKMMETAGWVLAVVLLGLAGRHFFQIDQLWQVGAGGSIDPGDAARAFTGALRGVLNWAGLLIVIGLLAIVGAFAGRRKVERSSSSVSQ